MSDEIEQIRAEAAALDGEAQAAPISGEVIAAPDPLEVVSAEIEGLIKIVVATLAPALPSLSGIYTDQTTRAAAGAVAAVCVKRGWLAGGLFGEYREEISAAVILIPLGIATYRGVLADLEAGAKPAETAGHQE